jgi:putative flippase GtrA
MKQPALELRREGGQLLRYALAGVFGNVLVYLVYLLLASGVGVRPNPAFALACILILPVSFFISRNWTFRADVSARRAFPAFVAGYFASYLLQAAAFQAGMTFTSLPPAIVLPLAQAGAIAFFFALQRLVIFAARKP